MSPRAWMIATACVACAEPPSAHTDDQGSYALELRAELSVRGPDQAWQTSGLQMTATLGLADEAMALREVSCRPTQASGSLAQVERACRGLEATYGLAREPSGRLITIGLPDGLTMEGEALIKQLAGLLQLSVPPGAGSGWTTEEFDHMGTYVAHYGRTDRAITRTHEDYAQVASGEGLRPVGPTELRGAATTQWTFDDAGAWRSVVHTSTWQREALAEAGLPESRVETSLLLEREGEPVPLLEPQVLTWVAPFAQSSEAAVQDSIDRHRLGTVAPEAWLDRVLIANLSSDPTPHSDTPLVDQAFLTLVSVFRQRADLLDRSVAPCVDANPDRAETCRVVTGALGAAGTPRGSRPADRLGDSARRRHNASSSAACSPSARGLAGPRNATARPRLGRHHRSTLGVA
ncbi:MAG: hypothetical protein AAGA48_27515 [Myxococcota bacterium]